MSNVRLQRLRHMERCLREKPHTAEELGRLFGLRSNTVHEHLSHLRDSADLRQAPVKRTRRHNERGRTANRYWIEAD